MAYKIPPTEKQVKCMLFIIHTLNLYGGYKHFEDLWFEDCTKQKAQEFISEYLSEANDVAKEKERLRNVSNQQKPDTGKRHRRLTRTQSTTSNERY